MSIISDLRRLAGFTSTEEAKEPIDVSNGAPDWKTVIRVVRPNNHVGKAFGGDRVRISEDEARHPVVAKALLTEEQHAELEKRQARRMLQLLTGEGGGSPNYLRNAARKDAERRNVVAGADANLARHRWPERDPLDERLDNDDE